MSNTGIEIATGHNYEHDCDQCVFLGTGVKSVYDESPKKAHKITVYDFYYCDKDGEQTVIARWGNEPYEYSSGISGALFRLKEGLPSMLSEAYGRAVEKGFVESWIPKELLLGLKTSINNLFEYKDRIAAEADPEIWSAMDDAEVRMELKEILLPEIQIHLNSYDKVKNKD